MSAVARGVSGAKPLTVIALALLALTMTGCGGCSKKDEGAPDAQAFLASLMDAGDGGKPDAGTDDTAMPAENDPDLEQRMRHLLEAVAQNNPDLAGDALFPRDAFVQAKDSSDPQKMWDSGVSRGFRHSVESMHNRMKGIEHAKFESFELGHSITKLDTSKKHFKKPLWQVKHSKIKCTIDGKEHTMDILEMTAWRGAWYVTRLH